MVKKEKLVSIIVPIYNVESFITECIESLVNQTYRNIEIILVNDGSKDDSLNVCMKYASKDSRIKILNKKNGGLSSARNFGIDAALGDYITFIDGDDYVSRIYVEQLLKSILDSNASVSIGGLTPNIEKMNEIIICKYKLITGEKCFKGMLKESILTSACAKLFKSDCFSNFRFCEGKIYEDYELIPRIIGEQKTISIVNSNIYFYRLNPQSITNVSFNPNRMDYFYVSKQIEEYTVQKYPKYIKYVKNRETRYAISFYKQIAKANYNNKEIESILRRTIRNNFLRYLFSSYSIFSKMYGALICISSNVAKRLFSKGKK